MSKRNQWIGLVSLTVLLLVGVGYFWPNQAQLEAERAKNRERHQQTIVDHYDHLAQRIVYFQDRRANGRMCYSAQENHVISVVNCDAVWHLVVNK